MHGKGLPGSPGPQIRVRRPVGGSGEERQRKEKERRGFATKHCAGYNIGYNLCNLCYNLGYNLANKVITRFWSECFLAKL